MHYMIDLIKAERDTFLAKNSSNPGSIIVHCSAGVGRTGTLIVLYILAEAALFLRDFNEDLSEPDAFFAENGPKRISLFSVVRRVREQRWNMVKTEGQYKYVYEFFKKWAVKNGIC